MRIFSAADLSRMSLPAPVFMKLDTKAHLRETVVALAMEMD
jgi:hypothetical protein